MPLKYACIDEKLNAEASYTRSLLDHWEKGTGMLVLAKPYTEQSLFEGLILAQKFMPCSNSTVSRKAWERAGCYQSTKSTTTEDHDMWIAISRKTDFMI